MSSSSSEESTTQEQIPHDFLSMEDDLPPKILWSCVSRNNTILAEASDVTPAEKQAVTQTAKELLDRKPTPGFEYHTQSRLTNLLQNRLGKKFRAKLTETSSSSSSRPLKGIKFHVYEHISTDDSDLVPWEEDAPHLRIWIFAAVFDGEHTTRQEVQSFIEKIVTITETFRDDDYTWQTAETLGLQDSFAPVLQQRMEEVTYLGKVAMLQQKVHACQEQMEENIQLILERGEKIEDLDQEANHMKEMTKVFKKKAKEVKRKHMLKNAKYGLIAGTAATTVVAAAAIPLVALL